MCPSVRQVSAERVNSTLAGEKCLIHVHDQGNAQGIEQHDKIRLPPTMAEQAVPQRCELYCRQCAGVRRGDQQQVTVPLRLQRVPGAWQCPSASV